MIRQSSETHPTPAHTSCRHSDILSTQPAPLALPCLTPPCQRLSPAHPTLLPQTGAVPPAAHPYQHTHQHHPTPPHPTRPSHLRVRLCCYKLVQRCATLRRRARPRHAARGPHQLQPHRAPHLHSAAQAAASTKCGSRRLRAPVADPLRAALAQQHVGQHRQHRQHRGLPGGPQEGGWVVRAGRQLQGGEGAAGAAPARAHKQQQSGSANAYGRQPVRPLFPVPAPTTAQQSDLARPQVGPTARRPGGLCVGQMPSKKCQMKNAE